jgi:hypothetical protein
MRRMRGISLPELLLVMALFSLFLLIPYQVMKSGLMVGLRTESSEDVAFQLRRAYVSLGKDLRTSSRLQMNVDESERHSVLWFLSAVDEETGQLVLKEDGKPFWQRNIIYFTAIPEDHDSYYGVRCSQTSYCPHKVLVRRVVDAGPLTEPDSAESEIEEILTPSLVQDWVERPGSLTELGFTNSAEEDRLIATGLLDFKVVLEPEGWDKEISCTLKGFSNKESGKSVAIGAHSLENSPFTHEIEASFFPGN